MGLAGVRCAKHVSCPAVMEALVGSLKLLPTSGIGANISSTHTVVREEWKSPCFVVRLSVCHGRVRSKIVSHELVARITKTSVTSQLCLCLLKMKVSCLFKHCLFCRAW